MLVNLIFLDNLLKYKKRRESFTLYHLLSFNTFGHYIVRIIQKSVTTTPCFRLSSVNTSYEQTCRQITLFDLQLNSYVNKIFRIPIFTSVIQNTKSFLTSTCNTQRTPQRYIFTNKLLYFNF